MPSHRLARWLTGLCVTLCACSETPAGPPAPAPESVPESGPAPAPAADEGATIGAPKLVVVLVVDQMRDEMLERYGPHYDAGFRRLLDEGIRFRDTRHAHAVTYTAPGHASIATGTFPRQHGIVANYWVDGDGVRHFAAADPAIETLGTDTAFHGSPSKVQRDALGDWLKRAHPEAKVWSVALKDRAAIMMGGQKPDGVLWWNDTPARYVSTRHYFDALPTWLEGFAAQWPVEELTAKPWEAPKKLHASRERDEEAWEGEFSAFPHGVEHYGGSVGRMVRYTPRGEQMHFALAKHLIEQEGLGVDGPSDVLWLGASVSDWIGHRFGPRSHEMEAHHLELDHIIGDFLDYLDQRFPDGDYLVVLTSDHGAADIPESRADAGRIDGTGAATRFLAELEREGTCPRGAYELSIYYGLNLLPKEPAKAPSAEAKAACLEGLAKKIRTQSWALEVLTPAQLSAPESSEDSPFAIAAKRSHYPGRSAELAIRLPENHLFKRGYTTGTTHGSAYTYDQRVPLLIYSPRLTAGIRTEPVLSVDLAPTLAHLLDTPIPEDLAGEPIASLLADFASLGWSKPPTKQ